MKKILLILGITILLTGCFLKEDLQKFTEKYARGYMDLMYHNDKALYKETTNETDEKLLSLYEESVEIESDYFIEFFELENISNEDKTRLTSLIKKAYDKTKYEISLKEKINEEKYSYNITIQPNNIIKLTEDSLIAAMNSAAEEELNTLLNNWNKEILNILEKEIDNIGYFETVTVELVVYKADNGLWTFDEDDLSDIDTQVVKYDYNEE